MSRTDQTEAKIATLSATPASQTATRPARVGVLLLNLGTPDGTEFKPMWRYLREFLSDPRIVELNRLIWYPILYGLVLTVRPKKSGENYARIWNRERNESPLHTFTRSQSEKLGAALRDLANVSVDWGMRYGNPSTGAVARKLVERGCDRILSFPL
jgi:ferrochelatase